MNSEIERLKEEAKTCENFEERNDKFDQIDFLEEEIFNLELSDWATEVKNLFKGING